MLLVRFPDGKADYYVIADVSPTSKMPPYYGTVGPGSWSSDKHELNSDLADLEPQKYRDRSQARVA